MHKLNGKKGHEKNVASDRYQIVKKEFVPSMLEEENRWLFWYALLWMVCDVE